MKTNLSTCCPPLLREHLQSSEAEQLAVLFRVLGEASRLQLLSLIAAQPTGAACVCELIEPLGLSQPTVSHHLKVLYDAGFLTKERRGTWIYYRVVPETLQAICGSLKLPDRKSAAP
ncbi:MAG: helix-turn-helix transcriptional regulator [Acaryochloridaceae cyanobacterium RU_4_10]|nr:helix-turn-helix transcriptional regulator [Acaryochloridaceae cyanobacterium RU_4_10]